MSSIMDFVAKNFRGPPPPLDRTRPPVAPPPPVELSAREVLGLPPPRWPSVDELEPVIRAKAELERARGHLAQVEAALAAARAASSAKARGPEDLAAYLKDGRLRGRDKNAAAAGEQAGELGELAALARAEVGAREAALAAALADAPRLIGAAVEADHRRALRAWAEARARVVPHELLLRADEQECVAHFRRCGLPTDKLPCGFPPHGVHYGGSVFDSSLDFSHPMAAPELVAAFEALRRAGIISYPELDDPRELGLVRVSDRALRGLFEICEAIAAAAPAEAELSEPDSDRCVADPAGTGAAAGPEPTKPEPKKGS
jgi:hypothetical protein